MTAVEEWRPIAGFPDYQVSSLGRVASYQDPSKPRVLRPSGSRYVIAHLYRDRIGHARSVHRLVVEAFHGPIPPGHVVRHLDGNFRNNTAANLIAGTPSENSRDVIRHGRHREANRDRCDAGHLYTERNTYIRRGGHRDCRACNARRQRDRYNRRAFQAAGMAVSA